MNTENIMASPYHAWYLHTIQKPSLLKTWEFYFFLVWLMELSNMYLHVQVKEKFFLKILTRQTQLPFNVSMKTINELYVLLMGFIHCLKKRSRYSTRLYKNLSFYSRVGILDFPWCNNSCHAFQELGQGDFYSFDQEKVPFLLIFFTTYPQKNVATRKIMLTSISSIAFAKKWTSIGL